MTILAVYFPKPEELTWSITLILIAFGALCGCAVRMKLSVPFTAFAMAISGTLFVLPDLLAVLNDPRLASSGALAREFNHSDHSDAFFGVTAYLEVGRGRLMAFAGMSAALLTIALLQALLRRRAIDWSTRQADREKKAASPPLLPRKWPKHSSRDEAGSG